MFVAEELRKKNIAEYLLYMWQVEDTIRAFGCSLSRLREEYVSRFDYSEKQQEDELDWLGNLLRMMNEEGRREHGHLQINNATLQFLNDLHIQLLGSSKYPFYNAQYYRVLPYIVELRNKKGVHKDESEVETCLNLLYGVLMLRLQKRELSPQTKAAVEQVSQLVGMLADYYRKDKEAPLDF
jgi:hypothetical protein